ncbi:MAG: hypothetical protein AB1352_00920 [Patescibacteria group bacterium]
MADSVVHNPMNELVVRDADGRFKVLKNGKLEDWDASRASHNDRVKHIGLERAPLPVGAPVKSPTTPPARADVPARASPPVAARQALKPVARYYVDVGDEEEIDGYRQAGDKERIEKIHELVNKKADEILKTANLPVDPEIRPRLVRVIVSRLRDVRDLMETKEVLMRPRELGGVNMDNAAAQTLLQFIEERRGAFEDEVRGVKVTPVKPEEEAPAPLRVPQKEGGGPAIARVAAAPAKPFEVPSLVVKEPRPFVHPSYKPEARSQKPEAITEVARQAVTPPVKVSPPVAPPKAPAAELRSTVTDVRTFRRVMGPIDELKTMTIEDFRRLGATAPMMAAKVVEKIELLADESLLKRNEGVLAWKSSPLHQLYLVVGAESLEKGMDVAHVIEEHVKKKHPVFTKDEFDAIADINRKLAY